MNRRLFLGLVLIGTLLAAWFAPPMGNDDVQLSTRARDVTAASASSGSLAVERLRGGDISVLSIRSRDEESGDEEERLFASMHWTQEILSVEPDGALTAQIDPPPQAPPLPFRVLGRYDESGKTVVFLEHQEQNLVVRAGEKIANDYKVESINDSTLTLRYLPLDQVQTLEVGGS